jgi:pilus assembly protein Flp/PilA
MKNSLSGLVERVSNVASCGNNLVSDAVLRLHFGIQNLLIQEDAQDLVEYALVVALIAFGASAAMKGLSSEIKTAFNAISSDLATSL